MSEQGTRSIQASQGTHSGEASLLRVENLSVTYDSVQAVRSVSLEVDRGEVVALLGTNGAGKTSLLRAISGAVRPSVGRVLFNRVDLVGKRPDQILRLGCAHVLEGRHVFAGMTVDENLRIVKSARRSDGFEEDLKRVYDLFGALDQKRKQIASTLSGGQQQMLVTARALLARPSLLLLDEPSLGLAPVMLEAVADLVSWANTEMGAAVLIVEQHAALALAVSQRAYVMARGRLVASAPSSELQDEERLRLAYMGDLEAIA